jgi:hypothetical protein
MGRFVELVLKKKGGEKRRSNQKRHPRVGHKIKNEDKQKKKHTTKN